MFHRAPIAVALFAAAALAACATEDTAPENPQAVVNARVAIMKSFAGALGATGAFADGKGSAAAAKTRLVTARDGVARLENLFPRGTALGDRGVTTSRALSTIFANRSDFDKKHEALADALATLDAALAKGAKADTARALNAAKNACQACHGRYRAAEE
jgi:cytochrome c556